jgi:hypothetical protein
MTYNLVQKLVKTTGSVADMLANCKIILTLSIGCVMEWLIHTEKKKFSDKILGTALIIFHRTSCRCWMVASEYQMLIEPKYFTLTPHFAFSSKRTQNLCVFKVSIARTLGLFTKSSLPYTLH